MNSYPATAETPDFSLDADLPSAAAWLPTIRMVLAFAAGALTPFTIELLGLVPLGEIVLAGALAYMVLYMAVQHRWPDGLMRSPLLWAFVAFQVVAFTGYVLADIYWGSSTTDMARGWARMVFLGIDILALAFLFYGPGQRPLSGFVSFQAGYAVGMVWTSLFGYVLFEDYWKFGWALPVTISVLLVAPRLGFWVTQAACLGLGLLHVAMDFRSLAGICLLVPVALMVQWLPRGSRAGVLLVAAIIGFGAWTFRPQKASGRTAPMSSEAPCSKRPGTGSNARPGSATDRGSASRT
jgi:hypothetical protein